MAYRQALGGRPGPVYLEIPMDILYAKIEESDAPFPTNYRTTSRPAGSPVPLENTPGAGPVLVRISSGSGSIIPGDQGSSTSGAEN